MKLLRLPQLLRPAARSRPLPLPVLGAVAPPRHLPALDALRGVACLMVLVAHLKAVPLLSRLPDAVGVAGVGIFFVLSGFLITRILLAERGRPGSLLGFYQRRVARIFPVYYLTLAVVALTWPGREVGWAATFTFNFRFAAGSRDYFQTEAPPVAHFWSLCVEEHFYWLWPLLLAAIPVRIARWLPLVVIAATPLLAWHVIDTLSAAGYSRDEIDGLCGRVTPLQLVAICAGALAAFHERWLSRAACSVAGVVVRRGPLVGLLLGAGVAAAWLESDRLRADVTRACSTAVLHLLCGAVFLAAVFSERLGRVGLLTWVGRISYGAYLYHLPLYAWLGLTGAGAVASPWRGLLALTLTVALAAASYRWLEAPVLARARRDRRARRPLLGAALTLAVAVAFVVGLGQTYMTPAAPETRPEPPATALAESVEVIVLGSSHAELGVVAGEMDRPTYNMAYSSQDVYYDCQVVRKLLPKLPKLKRVIFTVSAFTFRLAVSDCMKWLESPYYQRWGIRSRIPGVGEDYYTHLSTAGTEDALTVLAAKAAVKDEPQRGWRWLRSETFDPKSCLVRAGYHSHFDTSRVAENRRLLAETIELLQASGVECVLVSTPTHPAYRAALPAGLWDEGRMIAREIAARTGVRYLDYSEDGRFGEGDMYDGDHLNDSGARKFTRIVENDIGPRTPGSD